MSKLKNIGAERAALAGLVQYGVEVYFENNHFLNVNVFSDDKNQLIFSLIKDLYVSGSETIDLASLVTQAHNAGIYELVCKSQTDQEYLRAIFHFDIDRGNISKQIKHLYSLYVARKAQQLHQRAYKDLESFDVSKGLSDILTITESPLSGLLEEVTEEDKIEKIGDNLDDYIEYLETSEIGAPGIVGPWPIFNSVVGSGGLDVGVHLIGARAKALVYGSKVYTKNGPVNIESLKVGDKILHPHGGESIVEKVFDFDNKDIYRVYFSNRDYIDCCEDHLWEVEHTSYHSKHVKSTKELSKNLFIGTKGKARKWSVGLPKQVDFISQKIPVDPYVLGVLIGDGCFTRNEIRLTTSEKEILDKIPNVELAYELKDNKSNVYRLNSIKEDIKSLGLMDKRSNYKFVPDLYKYNDRNTRVSILQGLMDSDGSCVIDRTYTRNIFRTKSEKLSQDIKEIVESLGGLCLIRTDQSTRYEKSYGNIYTCEIFFKDLIPFTLSRKRDRYKNATRRLHRTITNIEHVGVNKARCIKISNNDGLFLTDNHIITHNCGKSTLGKDFAVHVSKTNVPTLIIDTEQSWDDQVNRILAGETGIDITEIRNKTYRTDQAKVKKVKEAAARIRNLPLYHKNVSGHDFEYILNYIKRWLHRDVGFTNGQANKHFIVYDYFKLTETTTLKDMQEYQAMGFQIAKLHDFCKIHNTSVLSFVQLNRDGITKDTTDVISQSDRLIWNAVSISLLKRKTSDEIGTDGIQNGNMKLIPLEGRFMTRMDDGDYINLNMDFSKSKVTEISTRSNPKSDQGFEFNSEQ